MRTIVTDKILNLDRVESTASYGVIRIIFDENMYVDPKSNFINDLNVILDYAQGKMIDVNTMKSIEYKINILLHEYRNLNLLFLENELLNKKGYIILEKDRNLDKYEKI